MIKIHFLLKIEPANKKENTKYMECYHPMCVYAFASLYLMDTFSSSHPVFLWSIISENIITTNSETYYSGTSTYEFNSFRNLARMSNCSYLKAIFPIEIH